MLDGAPIVAIATTGSKNRKTGDMVQTWILCDTGAKPTDASKSGADLSICGDCPQRWHTGGACYVNIGQAPQSIYAAYQRGSYVDSLTASARALVGFGQRVRLGAYGDPAAVPAHVWHELLTGATGHTGYTHQWRREHAQALRSLCMASVDSLEEQAQARAAGWRTFRVATSLDALQAREFECASTARGTSCSDCMACDGAARGPGQASVAILVHGSLAKRFAVRTAA